jgi:hypothetical protein
MGMGQFGIKELVERIKAAREGGAKIHSPTDRERKDFGAMFKQVAADGAKVPQMLLALDYMVAKAAGEVEGEPRAWCGFRTAFDKVALEGWLPARLASPSASEIPPEEARPHDAEYGAMVASWLEEHARGATTAAS